MTAERYDYIIVGAGSAGCVLADRLTRDGKHRVLLLEAGGKDADPWIHIPLGYGKTFFDPKINWLFQTEPEPHLADRRIAQPRGKVLGGSSSINGMLYVRGQRQDYDGWRDLGNPGWGFDDVLPYFKRSEDQQRGPDPWHGVGGPLTVSDVAERHPIADGMIAAATNIGLPRNDDFNGARQEGVGYYQATQRKGLRCSAAKAYLRPARQRRNLHVRTDALVTRITFEGPRATGILYRHGEHEHQAFADAEVVLAAGAFQSPQLLQLSGIGPADLLARHGIPVVHDLPGVGANLQDHLHARLVYECRDPITLNDAMKSRIGRLRMSLRFALTRKGPLRWMAMLAGGFLRTRPELDRPDIQISLVPYSSDRKGPVLHDFSGFTLVVLQLRPQSRGTVRIRSAHAADPPAIQPNYLADPADARTLVDGVKLARRITRDDAMAPLIEVERDPGSGCVSDDEILDFIRHNAATVFHAVGTCRMGLGPDAVVDPELRVRGVSALRVIDASIMPSLISGNTNAAAIMIGEKGADLLLRSAAERNWKAA